MLPEADYVCPHCGEEVVVPVDPSQGDAQAYVEDCPVCCSPILLRLSFDASGRPRLRATPE